jgi:transcription-repair coupling factor (superfamily II helicase)
VAAVGFELYCQMLDEAVQLAQFDGDGRDGSAPARWEPVRIDVPVDAYIPETYVPYEVAKIDVHRRIAAAREIAALEGVRAELEDRFGPPPDPVENLIGLQEARIRLGAHGVRTLELRGEQLALAPVELDSDQAKSVRGRVEGAIYESRSQTLRVRVDDDVEQRFAAIRRLAEALSDVSAPAGQPA